MFELIIIGGGNSIRSMPNLWNDIIGYNVMTINYAYKFVKEIPKYQVSIDPRFWKDNKEEMDRLALAGCQLINRNKEYVTTKEKYFANGNLFCGQRKLSGVFALDYAIRIIKPEIIFLFGYDFCAIDGKTHFYDMPTHSGTNKYSAYQYGDGQIHGSVYDFDNFKGHRIIIVGKSAIKSFSKIDYSGFQSWLKDLR